MLSQAIGDLLPSAIGVALSPVPIAAVILMLGTRRGRSNGPSFALGWVVGLVVVSIVVLVVTHEAGSSGSAASQGVRWGTLTIGVLFVLLAIRQLRARPREGESPEMPRWLATIDRFTVPRSAISGIALSGVNPKNLALTATAAAAIATQGLTAGGNVVAVAVFVIVATASVGGPVLFALVAPERATRPLESVKSFVIAHNAVIMFVILLVLGAKLIGDGISG